MTDESNPGYKRPPKATRFKAGASGNPRGRPKGSRNLKTDLTKLLKKRITVREDGEVRHISRQESNRRSLMKTAYALASARSPEFEKWIPEKK
jgi:Family of unknown function (DUF5681)